jgi:hypothetical protein
MADFDPSSSLPPGNWPQPRDPFRQASLFVWLTAAVNVLLFGCCSGVAAMFATIPTEQLTQSLQERHVSAAQIEQVVQVQPAMPILAAAMFLLFVLPGIALFVLGFPIRRGRRGAATAASVILWIMVALFTLMLLANIAGAITEGAVGSAVLYLLLLGALIALLLVTLNKLARARRGDDDFAEDDDEPWNRHLSD